MTPEIYIYVLNSLAFQVYVSMLRHPLLFFKMNCTALIYILSSSLSLCDVKAMLEPDIKFNDHSYKALISICPQSHVHPAYLPDWVLVTWSCSGVQNTIFLTLSGPSPFFFCISSS